jgi:hypothetical protein
VPEYRIFVRELDNDFLGTGFTFICPNDQEALALTEKLMDGRDVELRQSGRHVARIIAPRQPDRDRVNSRKPTTLRHYLTSIQCKVTQGVVQRRCSSSPSPTANRFGSTSTSSRISRGSRCQDGAGERSASRRQRELQTSLGARARGDRSGA